MSATLQNYQDLPGQQRFYPSYFPESADHLMRLANQAVARANIPSEIMTREECLNSALYGIARGWDKYNRKLWQSSLEWLSMQAYYQIKNDCDKRLRTLNQEPTADNLDQMESPKTVTPLEAMVAEESAEGVEALLSVLSKRDRKIVTRIVFHGDSCRAVARRLGIKFGEVKKRYQSALDKMRLVAVIAAEAVEDS